MHSITNKKVTILNETNRQLEETLKDSIKRELRLRRNVKKLRGIINHFNMKPSTSINLASTSKLYSDFSLLDHQKTGTNLPRNLKLHKFSRTNFQNSMHTPPISSKFLPSFHDKHQMGQTLQNMENLKVNRRTFTPGREYHFPRARLTTSKGKLKHHINQINNARVLTNISSSRNHQIFETEKKKPGKLQRDSIINPEELLFPNDLELRNTVDSSNFPKTRVTRISSIPENKTIIENTIDYSEPKPKYYLPKKLRWKNRTMNASLMKGVSGQTSLVSPALGDARSKSMDVCREEPESERLDSEKRFLEDFMKKSLKLHVREHVVLRPA